MHPTLLWVFGLPRISSVLSHFPSISSRYLEAREIPPLSGACVRARSGPHIDSKKQSFLIVYSTKVFQPQVSSNTPRFVQRINHHPNSVPDTNILKKKKKKKEKRKKRR